jgi:hypothetical protein
MFKLLPISTKVQLADFFTKALTPKVFHTFISKLGMLNLFHAPACGRVIQDTTKTSSSAQLFTTLATADEDLVRTDQGVGS